MHSASFAMSSAESERACSSIWCRDDDMNLRSEAFSQLFCNSVLGIAAKAPDQKRAVFFGMTSNLAPVFCIWMLYAHHIDSDVTNLEISKLFKSGFVSYIFA
jgi:hypothetical protein